MAAPPFNTRRAAGTIPTPYSPANAPVTAAGWPRHSSEEFEKIAATLETIVLLLPQSADREPKRLVEGVIRFAKSPWRPVAGQTTDRWVTYVAGAWSYL